MTPIRRHPSSYSSRDISIIVPTITGREEWLEKCLQSYADTAPKSQVIVIKDEASCGAAWRLGADQADRRYLHFTADDITPNDNWFSQPMGFLDDNIIPAAYVYSPNGDPAMCDSPLGALGTVPNILVPFLTRELVDRGGWFVDFHYGTDDWITYKARDRGYEVKRCPLYAFTHHVAPQGRDYTRRHGDVLALVQAMAQVGYVPPIYEQLEINLRTSKTGLASVSLAEMNAKASSAKASKESITRSKTAVISAGRSRFSPGHSKSFPGLS